MKVCFNLQKTEKSITERKKISDPRATLSRLFIFESLEKHLAIFRRDL